MSENEFPESFIGSLAAFEGVTDGHTVIHGPTGCKLYPASLMEDCHIHSGSSLPHDRNLIFIGSTYFFGQPRIPCTYLDMGSFITGATERLQDLVGCVSGLGASVISVLNSPGASLVGEDLTSIESDVPLVLMDHPIYSGTVSDGFQDGLLRLIERIGPEECTQRKGVSLTGLSITHLNWKDTLADLTSLLNACGIGVNMCIGAGWTVEDIRRSASAELIVPVYPEYGDKVAEYYHDKFGTPVFVSPEGAPVGFEALETWIRGVCGKVGADPSPALKMIREKRTRTAQVVSRMDARNSLPKGRTFAVECDGSMAYATVRFLHEYLGMIPVAVRCTCGTEWDSRISEYLDVQGIPVSDEPEDTESDIIISSGPVCSAAVERGIASECLVIERPSHRSVFIDPAPPVGLGGTVSMLESVLEAVSRHHYFH